MRKFIRNVFSIILFLFFMLFILDIVYTQLYKTSIPRNSIQYILKSQNKKFDIVFLGSSRVASHIDTELFESLSNQNVINLGVEGVSLNDNLLQLNLMIDYFEPFSSLFLQIDANFNSETPSILATSDAMPFLKNEIIKNHFKKYNEDFNNLYYLPFYKYIIYAPRIGFREAFFTFLNKNPKIDPSIGFIPKFGNDISISNVLPNSISNKNLILEEIITICKENNIELILYASPYCSKIINKDYIGKLKNKIPHLIDLTNGYEDELFYDCGHLNIQGAKIFTEKLYNSIFKKEIKY